MLTAEMKTLLMPLTLGDALPNGAAKQAVDILGRRIANDAYLPGEIMPTEPELADSLGVSRATIRDAIKVLSGKGLVRTARRYGTRVRPIEEEPAGCRRGLLARAPPPAPRHHVCRNHRIADHHRAGGR